MSQALYSERSRNPLARTVELTEQELRRGGKVTPLRELNLPAMAEAFLRGHWLGGGGSERPLDRLATGSGIVPVTRVTGTTVPLTVRRAAEFTQQLGSLAVRHCGGTAQLSALAERARAEGVPLWIARRYAHGPAGQVAVAVDRRLVRVDVWGPGSPPIRIRAPHGFLSSTADQAHGLRMTVGDIPAALVLKKKLRKAKSYAQARLPQGVWELRRANYTSSWLLRDEQRVALIQKPPRRPDLDPDTVLLPLAPVHYESRDPLDAVMAQAFAVAFGLGDTTGTARFRLRRSHTSAGEPLVPDDAWGRPWFSNLGSGRDDNEPGGSDGWGSDGDGGDGGGGGGDGGGDGGGGGGGGD